MIGLPAGVVVERFPSRQTQIAMDVVRAGVFFGIANASFLPSIVPEAELTARNNVTSGSIAATSSVAPPRAACSSRRSARSSPSWWTPSATSFLPSC